MNDNKEYDNSRVLFLQKAEDGSRFGSGEWDKGQRVYLNNLRKSPDGTGIIGDVSVKTGETYFNKNNEVRNKHRTCGILKINNGASEATLVIEFVEGKKETLTCTPKTITSKSTGQPMLMFDFSGRTFAPQNPYESDVVSQSKKEEGMNLDDLDDLEI